MDTFDLELAFHNHLIALFRDDFYTADPGQIITDTDTQPSRNIRQGFLPSPNVETVAFGFGVYTRAEGFYQIDLRVSLEEDSALEVLKKASDSHLLHFFPLNGRGITVTENATSAHIVRRPQARYMGKEGSYLREIIEVDYYVEIPVGV